MAVRTPQPHSAEQALDAAGALPAAVELHEELGAGVSGDAQTWRATVQSLGAC
jgi:hypothetical protein